ncbi:MAG: carbohydrate ABC transporter permease [Lachnospiraceae bacterium]|jgi:putative aldouronate transport system permease protein
MKMSKGQKVFQVFNYIILTLLAAACVLPLWHVLMASFSDPYAAGVARSFILYPLKGFHTAAYRIVFGYQGIWTGYLNTLIYVAGQCVIAVIASVIAGYILSRRGLRYKSLFMIILIIPLLFNGGMVPTFIVMQKVHLLDTRLVMILSGSMNVIYFIFMRLAIEGLPVELEESARLDGAGELRIMFQIILPLCRPTMAVIVLFTAVAKWNDYMTALIYLPTRTDLYPLQMEIREILNSATSITNAAQAVENSNAYSQLIQYAAVIVSIVPILCIYPFVQKYFVQGVTLGAVKG